MNKRVMVGIFVFSVFMILILSTSFSSASWLGDFWNKITGKSITGDTVAYADYDSCQSCVNAGYGWCYKSKT